MPQHDARAHSQNTRKRKLPWPTILPASGLAAESLTARQAARLATKTKSRNTADLQNARLQNICSAPSLTTLLRDSHIADVRKWRTPSPPGANAQAAGTWPGSVCSRPRRVSQLVKRESMQEPQEDRKVSRAKGQKSLLEEKAQSQKAKNGEPSLAMQRAPWLLGSPSPASGPVRAPDLAPHGTKHMGPTPMSRPNTNKGKSNLGKLAQQLKQKQTKKRPKGGHGYSPQIPRKLVQLLAPVAKRSLEVLKM